MMEIQLKIPNNLGVETFNLEFNNLTYDIYYETFNKDLHISFLENIKSSGGITRAFAQRLVYAMLKTKTNDVITFREFIFGLDDSISNFLDPKGWGSEFSVFILSSPFAVDTLNLKPSISQVN